MLYVPGLALIVLSTCASIAANRIDGNSFVPCSDDSSCLPWQTCASCTWKNFPTIIGTCSDVTERGLCGYEDESVSCKCLLAVADIQFKSQLTREGECIEDSDCPNIARLKTGIRCATCIDSSINHEAEIEVSLIENYCTSPRFEPKEFLCSTQNLKRCSCGQLIMPGVGPVTQATNIFDQPDALADQNQPDGFFDPQIDAQFDDGVTNPEQASVQDTASFSNTQFNAQANVWTTNLEQDSV